MSRRLALVIGSTDYIDSGLSQLSAPGKDADDFARILKDKEIGAFDDVRVIVNESSASVIEAIDEFFDQKKPDDLLVLYFSGHGVKDELGSLYLAFNNTIRTRLRSTAIKSDYIREAMDQSRSKRQVLILDCCNSGAFPQGTKAELGGPMGMTKAFQGYGRFVLTASDATQFAWEGDKVIGETDKSLFTHFLIKGLEGEADSDGDGKITVDELYDYAYDEIAKVTPNQTPTKSSSKQEGEIVLRQNMRIEDIKPVPLPTALLDSMENPISDVRLGAVQQLTKLLKGKNLGMARSAREALEHIAENDDSRTVLHAALQVLEVVRQAEEEHLAAEKDKADQLVKQKIEEERIVNATMEADRLAADKAESERVAKKKAEEERIAKAKIEADRLAAEKAESERVAKQKAEEERIAKAKIEADRLAAEKADSNSKAQDKVLVRSAIPLDNESEDTYDTARPKSIDKAKVRTGKTANPQATPRWRPILTCGIVGIIGFCVVWTGIWAIRSYLNLGNPLPTQEPFTSTNEATIIEDAPTVEIIGTIKIATQSPLSGGQSLLGVAIKQGAELALEQLSRDLKNMGYDLQLAPYDDQATPDVGVANAKNIVADTDILCGVGHLNSGVMIPSSEEYHTAGLAFVSPANTNPVVTTRGYLEVNRIVGRDDIQAPAAEEFAFKTLGTKSVYIIHDKTAYGQGVAEFFKAAAKEDGIEVLGFEGTEETANFDAIVVSIIATNPDVVFFAGIYNQAGVFFKQARDAGYEGTFLGTDGMDSSDLADIAGNALTTGGGMFYTTVAGPASAYPKAAQFVSDYTAKFGAAPEAYAAQGYDAMGVCLTAIKAAADAAGGKPTRLQVAEAVRAVNYEGLTNTITFNEIGDLPTAKYFIIKVNATTNDAWETNEIMQVIEISPE